jgi:acetyl-CoA carboxylase carboxyltransferase component
MDEGSFEEIGMLVTATDLEWKKEQYYGDGVITGYGTINGRWFIFLLRILQFWRFFIRNSC